MLLVLLIELPYERYVIKSVLYTPLIINALFPPVLMFLIGIFIRVPSKKNTQAILKVAQEMVYKGQLKSTKGIGRPVKRSKFTSMSFTIFYLILFRF